MLPALIIIADEGYQDHEFAGTEMGLVNAGFQVIVASTEVGPCRGKFGGHVDAQMAIHDIDVKDFDRVAFIGGPGAKMLQDNSDAHRIAKDTVKAGKILGAICIAPTILAKAGVLKGKRATVWNEDGAQDQLLTENGATYTGDEVTIDGKIVTGNGPEAATKFGLTFASL